MMTRPKPWRGLKRTRLTTGILLTVCGLTPTSALRRCLEHRRESESANRVLNQLTMSCIQLTTRLSQLTKGGESANGLAPLALMASSGVIWLIWRFARKHMLRRALRGDQGTSSLDPTQESFAPWTHTHGMSPANPRGKTSRLPPLRSPNPAHCLFRLTAAPGSVAHRANSIPARGEPGRSVKETSSGLALRQRSLTTDFAANVPHTTTRWGTI